MRGKIICFEGIDGTGKTTQAKLLEKYILENQGDAIYVKLGSGFFSEILQSINKGNIKLPLSTRSMLYATDADFLDKTIIRPSVQNGKTVILDRQYLTMVIYGTIRNKDRIWIENMNNKLIKPDLTIVLHTDPSEIIKNRSKKIEIYETIRSEIDDAKNLNDNYIQLQQNANEMYSSYINDKDIIKISTQDGIDATFQRVIIALKIFELPNI